MGDKRTLSALHKGAMYNKFIISKTNQHSKLFQLKTISKAYCIIQWLYSDWILCIIRYDQLCWYGKIEALVTRSNSYIHKHTLGATNQKCTINSANVLFWGQTNWQSEVIDPIPSFCFPLSSKQKSTTKTKTQTLLHIFC